jgi:hypothetical protein
MFTYHTRSYIVKYSNDWSEKGGLVNLGSFAGPGPTVVEIPDYV